MGHRDPVDADLARYLDQLDADEATDNAIDALQPKLEAEFRAKLAAADPEACRVISEHMEGLTGYLWDAMVGSAAVGGDKFKRTADQIIYSHTLGLAERAVRDKSVAIADGLIAESLVRLARPVNTRH